MLSFTTFLKESSDVNKTIMNLLRLSDRPGTPNEGEVAMSQAKKLAAKHGINLQDIRDEMGKKKDDTTKVDNQHDTVFAMWEAEIRNADDHHHGFQMNRKVGTGKDVHVIYKSASYPEFELVVFLFHFELLRKGVEVAAGVSAGRSGPFRRILIMMDYVKRVCDWTEQIRNEIEKIGYVVTNPAMGINGYQTSLRHKKKTELKIRIFGYTTEMIDYSRGSAVAFEEKSSMPFYAKAKQEDPKSMKLFLTSIKAKLKTKT